MKKRVVLNAILILIIINLCACSSEKKPFGDINLANMNETHYHDHICDHANTQRRSQEEISMAIEAFPLLEFKGLDGNTVDKTEAIDAYDGILVYNFAYTRKPSSVFYNTFTTPEFFHSDTYELNASVDDNLFSDYNKVKQGQIIEGLEVIFAETAIYTMKVQDEKGNISREIFISYCGLELLGEIRLQGILHRAPRDDAYVARGDIILFPNTNLSPLFPLPYYFGPMPCNVIDKKNSFALYADSARIRIRNNNEIDVDQYFLHGDYTYVEVVLNDLVIAYNEGMGGNVCSAQLTNIVTI